MRQGRATAGSRFVSGNIDAMRTPWLSRKHRRIIRSVRRDKDPVTSGAGPPAPDGGAFYRQHSRRRIMSKVSRLAARVRLAAFVGSILFALAAQSGWAANKTYNFGVLFPLTGPNAVYGDVFNKGVGLAVEMVNDSHKLKGEIKAINVDSQALPQPAVVGMNQLVHVNDVPYMLTAFSGVSKAIAPIGNRFGVIMVNGGGVSPELAIGHYFLNDIPLADQEVRALLPYAVKEKKIHKIAVIHVDDPFGNSVNEQVRENCPKLGCKVDPSLAVNPSNTDFQGEVAKIRAAKPDAVFIASYGQQQNVITKQLRNGNVSAQLLSYSGYGVGPTLKLPEAQGAMFTHQSVSFDANALSKEFHEKYLKKYGAEPNFYVANYANAVFIFADLVQHLEAQKISVTGKHLLAELHRLKSFDVIGGPVKFSREGTVSVPLQINVIKDDKAVPLTVVNP
jgi:branched-chain amino acid transport system substrate-binding protein